MGWENAHEWRVGKDFDAEVAAYWTVQFRVAPRKTMNTLIQYNRGFIQCRAESLLFLTSALKGGVQSRIQIRTSRLLKQNNAHLCSLPLDLTA